MKNEKYEKYENYQFPSQHFGIDFYPKFLWKRVGRKSL